MLEWLFDIYKPKKFCPVLRLNEHSRYIECYNYRVLIVIEDIEEYCSRLNKFKNVF